MATLQENLNAMARLVSHTKTEFRLSEPTVVRLLEMNLSLAMNGQQPEAPTDLDEGDNVIQFTPDAAAEAAADAAVEAAAAPQETPDV